MVVVRVLRSGLTFGFGLGFGFGFRLGFTVTSIATVIVKVVDINVMARVASIRHRGMKW